MKRRQRKDTARGLHSVLIRGKIKLRYGDQTPLLPVAASTAPPCERPLPPIRSPQ